MANIKFRLNNGAKTPENKPYSIYIRYKYGRVCEINKAIGFKINPKYWSEQKQNVKNRSEVINRTQINDLITDLKRHFEDFESDLLSKGQQPTNTIANKHFKAFFKEPETNLSQRTLFDYFDYFDETKGKQLKLRAGTLKEYRKTKSFLQRFNDKMYPIDFDNIDMDFYYDFIEWAESLNYSHNYIGGHIKTLKSLLNNATKDKVNSNLAYKNDDFKSFSIDVDNIYLTLDELSDIYKKDLSHLPKLDHARDLFLIGAYTGLRISDFNNLTKENMIKSNGNDFLKVNTQKTDKPVFIPLRPEVKEIFKKHGNKPPKRMADQRLNKLIKDVCENVGIDEITYKTTVKGGKKITIKKMKFDMVSSHTARRSFCTNAYLSGMQTFDIMQISGHTSVKVFLNYIKADALQKANKISQHPFFKGNTLKVVSNG